MILDLQSVNIYVKPGVTDMRKQANGLSLVVESELRRDLFTGDLFLFCSRNRKLLKILYWDRTGFCLWQKRLERDKFPWPKDGEEATKIDIDEFRLLLKGIDFFCAHKQLKYCEVS